MARRSKDWNEGLAQDLRDVEFAREFIMAGIDRRGLSPGHSLEGGSGLWRARVFQKDSHGEPKRPAGNFAKTQSNSADTRPAPASIGPPALGQGDRGQSEEARCLDGLRQAERR